MAKEKEIMKKQINKKVKSKNKEKDNKPKEKFWAGIKKELKLVKWPTFKEIVKYTIATIIFCVIFVLFFDLLNMMMAYIKGLFN